MSARIGSWRVRVLEETAALDPAAVIIEEEDRYQVLSAPADIPDRPSHPIEVMSAVWSFEPAAVGTIVEASPRRWLAIVHDLDREPSLSEDTVRAALDAAFDRAEARGVERLAMHPWGVRFGPWPLAHSLDLLGEVLRARWRPNPRDLDLRATADQRAQMQRWLNDRDDR